MLSFSQRAAFVAALLAVAAFAGSAQAATVYNSVSYGNVNDMSVLPGNSTLTASNGLLGSDNGSWLNVLAAPTASTPVGYNFSGATGTAPNIQYYNNSYIGIGAQTGSTFYYTDYLISVAPSSADVAVITLNNPTGVSGLSERIYSTSGAGDFLGDNKPTASTLGDTLVQSWDATLIPGGSAYVATTPTGGVTLGAGLYVLEIRGTSQGNFGGVISLSAVPEVSTLGMVLAGMSIVGLVVARRRRA